MSGILFCGVSLAVISAIIEDNLSNKSSDKDLLHKKLIDIGIGAGTVSLIIRFLPIIVNTLKQL